MHIAIKEHTHQISHRVDSINIGIISLTHTFCTECWIDQQLAYCLSDEITSNETHVGTTYLRFLSINHDAADPSVLGTLL